MTTKTTSTLADAIIADLPTSLDLIYVDYRDELSPEQVAAIVRADSDALWESLGDWEMDATSDGVMAYLTDARDNVLDAWLRADEITQDEYDTLRTVFTWGDGAWENAWVTIQERDSGAWFGQLLRQTPDVLLRIAAIDEDHGYSFEPVEAVRVLTDLGIEHTTHNIATVQYALDNASPEYSVLMGYWIIGADVSEIDALTTDADAMVEIVNPHLYLGNPFAGSGFITEEPLQAMVRVRRGDLRTDKDAFGYSVDEVYGGLSPSSFSATLRPVAPVDVTP